MNYDKLVTKNRRIHLVTVFIKPLVTEDPKTLTDCLETHTENTIRIQGHVVENKVSCVWKLYCPNFS